MDPHLAAAVLVTVGVPILCTAGGALMGSLLNATLTNRASQRELERADQHQLLERVRQLELDQARIDGRGSPTTTTTTERTDT